MNKYALLGIGAVVIIAGGIFFFNQSESKSQPSENEKVVKEEQTMDKEAMMKDEDTSGNSNALSSRYIDYSEENLAKATKGNGKAIVFFKASWCPSCQAADADFKANLDKVPSDVTILKTDYDTATELKTKYGITMQDTFVQVDSEGNEIAKWNSGGEGIKTLLANVQ